MYEESLLEPIGEIGYEEREHVKSPYSITSPSGKIVETDETAAQTSIKDVTLNRCKKSLENTPPVLKESINITEQTFEGSVLHEVTQITVEVEANCAKTIEENSTTTNKLTEHIDKLIQKNINKLNTVVASTATTTIKSSLNIENKDKLDSKLASTAVVANDNKNCEEKTTDNEINSKPIDIVAIQTNTPQQDIIQTREKSIEEDIENDDLNLLQPMNEVPYTEDERIRPSKNRIKPISQQFEDENYTNSADEFSESSTSTEAYSEIELSDSESSNSLSQKKRKKSIRSGKTTEQLMVSKMSGKRSLPKVIYADDSSSEKWLKKKVAISKRKLTTQSKQLVDIKNNTNDKLDEYNLPHVISDLSVKIANAPPTSGNLFGRQKCNYKIDNERGAGHIVFHSTELTVVDKTGNKSSKLENVEDKHASSTTVSQDSFDENSRAKPLTLDVDILPICGRIKDANSNQKLIVSTNTTSAPNKLMSVNSNQNVVISSSILAAATTTNTTTTTVAASSVTSVVENNVKEKRTINDIVKNVEKQPSTVSEKRFKRQSTALKPTYYEWSENSMDQLDEKGIKIRKPHWKTLQKQKQMRKQGYNNWRAQLKTKPTIQHYVTGNVKSASNSELTSSRSIEKQSTKMLILTSANKKTESHVPVNDTPTSVHTVIKKGLSNSTQSCAATTALENGQSIVQQSQNKETNNISNSSITVETPNETIDTSAGILTTSLDDPLIGRKRIRKLKYQSYNFTEKRDQSKPKMVLKYKKRYKKRKKPAQLQVQSLPAPPTSQQEPHASLTATISPLNSESIKLISLSSVSYGTQQEALSRISPQLSSELTAANNYAPIKKKPGPKKGWKRARLEADKIMVVPTGEALSQQQQGKRKIQKYADNKLLPIKLQAIKHEDESASISTTITTLAAAGNSKQGKRKAIIDANATGSSSDADNDDIQQDYNLKKKLTHKKRKDEHLLPPSPSNRIYLENYSQVLQDRDKVLLEILEQRSAEIRDLKLRVSNLERSMENEQQQQLQHEQHQHQQQQPQQRSDRSSWSNAELANAYNLQKLIRPFYTYIQQKFTLPLPNQADIDRYIGRIRITKGIIKDVIEILENAGDVMNDIDRVTVLQICKIQTAAQFEYDKINDQILGKYNELTVIVANGLYNGWHYPIYIGFDQITIKDALLNIIKELHNCKFSVVACVCNYNEHCTDVWSELDVSMGCNYFAHPITTDFIYAFYYIDDILCAIRQHFIDGEGFTLDMKPINASPLERLISEKPGLTRITLETLCTAVKDNDRLKHARDLFSSDTVKWLQLCLPSDDELSVNCANFIDTISSFYNLMNSSPLARNSSILCTSVIGHSNRLLEDQCHILSEVQLNFYRLKCPGIERMSEFQKATMMTIESTKMLQHSMKQKHKIEHFAMKHITNDFLKTHLRDYTSSHSIVIKITPLQALNLMKQIFFNGNRSSSNSSRSNTNSITCIPTDHQDDDAYKLFIDVPIEKNVPECYYVQLLLDWIVEQHKIKHPFSTVSQDDLVRRFKKFEETFQTMQNPIFEIRDGPFGKVLKKFKAHTFGMSVDILQTFVIQRHLLRIKYNNLIGVKMEPCC